MPDCDTQLKIGGYPQRLSTVNRELYAAGQMVSCKRQEDQCQTPRIQHTHASKAIYSVCSSCIVQIFALTSLSGDKYRDLFAA